VLGALLAVGLVGCAPSASPGPTGGPSDDPDCVPAAAGAQSDAVHASDDLASAPSASFDAGLSVDATQRTVAVAGDGTQVGEGWTATVDITIYNGTTGEQVASTVEDYGDSLDVALDGTYLPGIEKAILCSHVGDRVVTVSPPADAYGSGGYAELGIGAEDSVVFVVDVLDAAEPLVPVPWTENLPEVTRAEDGTPTITLPDVEPPTDLELAVLQEGDGDVVPSGGNVTIDYLGMSWDTGEVFDESFSGSPASFEVGGVVAGFGAALVGQRVGSTIIVTMPPEDAYGTDPTKHALGGQSLVFLIDILEATPAG